MSIARRPRRLRQNPAFRDLVAETSLRPSDLILPMFVVDGLDEAREIPSMPGVAQHSLDSLKRAAHEALDAGVTCVDLFGVPREEDKDATGSVAWDPQGILNVAIAELRKEFGDDLIVMADTCLDEFTSHGHCGVIDDKGRVLNDETVELYQDMARSQARAGAHMVSPSGMMDGQIAAIREALDEAGHEDVAIMAYSAKYASAFYGPFRDAVGSSSNLGKSNKSVYQQDPANSNEALWEVGLDLEEGADMVMVKPGMPYLDVVRRVKDEFMAPTFVYHVSGEYAMIKFAAQAGAIDEKRITMETMICCKRAGADGILTYCALDVARWLKEGWNY